MALILSKSWVRLRMRIVKVALSFFPDILNFLSQRLPKEIKIVVRCFDSSWTSVKDTPYEANKLPSVKVKYVCFTLDQFINCLSHKGVSPYA